MFQLNLKVGLQVPKKFGSGVKQDNYALLSDNIHINWMQSTAVTPPPPLKPQKVFLKNRNIYY